nr:hypothetical protein [uncultured Dyadobacter sp.]
MEIGGNYRNILNALVGTWQAHQRLRNHLLTAMRKDTCPTLRRILQKAYLTSIVFERDIEELYNSSKSYLRDPCLNEIGFDPGIVRQHGVNIIMLMETISQHQSALIARYNQLFDLIHKEGFADQWCEQHLHALVCIHATTTSKVRQLFGKSDGGAVTATMHPKLRLVAALSAEILQEKSSRKATRQQDGNK